MSSFSLFTQEQVSDSYIFFDLETTGFHPLENDRVIEIAMIKYKNGQKISSLESLINPERPIPEEASSVNGIFDKDVAGQPVFDVDFANKIIDFIGDDAILVAHNSAFDLGFLSCAFARAGVFYKNFRSIDTLQIAQKIFPGVRNRLESLMKRYGMEQTGELHRALVDTELLSNVFFELIAERLVREMSTDTLVKKFGFTGDNYKEFIPDDILAYIDMMKKMKGIYKTQTGEEINLEFTPVAPLWFKKRWFLLGNTNRKRNKEIIIDCRKFRFK